MYRRCFFHQNLQKKEGSVTHSEFNFCMLLVSVKSGDLIKKPPVKISMSWMVEEPKQ